MRRIFRIAAAVLFFSLFLSPPVFSADETITITTYYPSPNGSYNELHANQMAVGTDYQTGVLPSNSLVVQGNVGIGTTAPVRGLEVKKNYGIRIQPSALPASPAAGDIAVDSNDNNTIKWYDGSAWHAPASTGLQASRTTDFDPYSTNREIFWPAAWVDIPNLELSITTDSGGSVFTLFTGYFVFTSNPFSPPYSYVRLFRDNTTELVRRSIKNGSSGSIAFNYFDSGLSAGSHTYKIQLYRNQCQGQLFLVTCDANNSAVLIAPANLSAIALR